MMQPHEWLTQELASLAWYAHFLREGLMDPAISKDGRYACAAGAKYLVAEEDLVPDDGTAFSQIDDLFTCYIALERLFYLGGPRGGEYANMEMPTGATIGQRIQEAKTLFGPFWTAIAGQVEEGFQFVSQAIAQDSSLVGQVIEELQGYINENAQRAVPPMSAESLADFMAPYGGHSMMEV